jgi:zinc protease
MLNRRLQERTREAEPPFLASFSGSGNLVRTKGSYNLIALVDEGGVERGLNALLTEAERVRRYGFTASELAREKAALLRDMEQAYRERDTVKSKAFAPGIARELELANQYVPGITLDEVNGLTERWLSESSRVVTVSGPQKPGLTLPDESSIAALVADVAAADVEPYDDTVSDQPLMAVVPEPAAITSEASIDELGVTEWRLANGVRVLLKPTDFKNDEVLFTAFSPGGTSLASDSDYIAATTADAVVLEAGVGEFDLTQLQKLLADKVVSVGPYISELEEGISGSASPEDLETAFQLVDLYFTEPRRSEQAFASVSQKYRSLIENRLARPESVFADTVTRLVTQDHFRRRPWTPELLDEMNLDASYRIYRDRFADASDFTFILVGSFDPENIRPLVQRYLGNLPATGRQETWRDVGVRAPTGVIEDTVVKGIEPKSQVTIIFSSDFDWSRENAYLMASMADVLRIRLRELIREDESGTYGVSVRASTSRIPRQTAQLSISFGCDPDRVDELKALVYDEVRRLQTVGPDQEHVAKVAQQDRREHEVQLRENGFWLASLESALWNEQDPRLILDFDSLVDSLTPESIREAAERWVQLDRRVEVILRPEAPGTAGEHGDDEN